MMFDEQQAVKFIKNYIPTDIAQLYSGDEILNIIDMIWDFYEDNGLLEIPATDDDTTLDEEKLLDYVNKMLKKDKLAVVDKDHVKYIVDGELAYERSIGLEE